MSRSGKVIPIAIEVTDGARIAAARGAVLERLGDLRARS
jgi:hypothetical protein